MSRNPTITLLHGPRFEPETAFRVSLETLGFPTAPALYGEWLHRSADYPADLLVLWICELDSLCRQAVECLERLDVPVLVVVPEMCTGEEILRRCREFIVWPCSVGELGLRVRRLAAAHRSRPAPIDLSGCLQEFAHLNFLGRSPSFVKCLRLIKKLAGCDVPVLLEGETGTGKELAARALHYLGKYKGMPFVPVNCGGLPDTLFEDELFGHERGAFTDAKGSREGLVAQAEGGTLFLDEVDTLSAKGQITLLRFLQDRQYRPLGGGGIRQSRVRIVAASNTVLEGQVAANRFRSDLLFRLCVARLSLPPLRERREDIPLLAQHFLRQFSTYYEKPAKVLHPESLDWLVEHPWPGNVRELENVIHREFLLSEGSIVRIDASLHTSQTWERAGDGLDQGSFRSGFSQARERVVREFEMRYLNWLMAETRGNVSHAARKAGKERRSLGRLLQKHGIDRRDYCGVNE